MKTWNMLLDDERDMYDPDISDTPDISNIPGHIDEFEEYSRYKQDSKIIKKLDVAVRKV